MRILSVEDVHRWLRTASLLDSDDRLDLGNEQGPIRVWIPDATGRKTNLARLLARVFESKGEGLLWINEFGIWPSSEYRLIFYALRQLVGESRPLDVAPGHIFGTADMETLGAIAAVALYFSWGALLVRGDTELIARISHDDFVDFFGTEAAIAAAGRLLIAQKYMTDDEWTGQRSFR